MNNLSQVLIFLCLAWIGQSCIVYHPPTADIPLISKKGEAKIDAGLALGAWVNDPRTSSVINTSVNATISYGLTRAVALQTFGTLGPDRFYLQGAVGHYRNLVPNRVLEIYMGAGSGRGRALHYRWFSSSTILLGEYQTYFTQVNYGIINNKRPLREYGFGIKTGLLHSTLTSDGFYADHDSERIFSDNSFLLEPNLFMKLGGKRVTFNLKLAGCWMYKFTNQTRYLPYSYVNLGLSLNYRLGK
ncbi:MAG: hypothetical protein V4714_10060 [Bacteroidota bacterium]